MDNLQLLGFIGLATVNLRSIILNKNDHNYLIGSIIISMGFVFRAIEFYNTINYNKKIKISKGHLFLGLFYLLSFVFDINRRHTQLNMIAVVGHLLLVKKNKYYNTGLILLAIYYVIQIQENMNTNNIEGRLRTISAIFILSFYIQELKRKKII